MHAIFRATALSCLFLMGLSFLGSCSSVDDTSPGRLQEVRPWRPYFSAPQSLVADELYIEGPEGLLEHVVLGHNSAAHLFSTETTPDGLLQIVQLRPGIDPSSAPIRVLVDSLDMRILRRVVVLEKVGVPPLQVRATGAVWWAREDGSGELRQELLVLPRDLPGDLREASAPVGSGAR